MHVRTRKDIPSVTTGYTVPNGFLKAYQISTQSAHPLRSYSKRVFSTPHLRRTPRAAVVTHITRYNSHRQKRRWSYPSEKTACQSDLRFKSYKLLHNVTCEHFDGAYGQCKPCINVTAHISLETEHYLAENFIFDDRQYEQHARRRCEISFSSIVEFERLSFGSTDARTDGHTTDGHNVINNIDQRANIAQSVEREF